MGITRIRCGAALLLGVLPLVGCQATERDGSELGQSGGSSVDLAALRNELLAMSARDQQARGEMIGLIGRGDGSGDATPETQAKIMRLRTIDAANTARLREIVDQHGWPTRSMVGHDGAHAAWLLIQHADADPEFQEAMLPKLEGAARRGEASLSDLALFVDRVRVAQGRPQLYGSQFEQDDSGEWNPLPIEDLENVDARRAEMGLSSLAEYRAMIGEVYGRFGGENK